MTAVDLKKTLDSYRARHGEFRTLEVPPHRYLAIDGHGDPNTAPEFVTAIEALYPLAYTLKFTARCAGVLDYVVPPLEGLWWADDPSAFTTARDKTAWSWTLLLLVPDEVPDALVDEARDAVVAKRPPARIGEVRLQPLAEGTVVQTLHLGSFDDEGPVLARLHDEVLPGLGVVPAGIHHEIYFSDVRRTAPEKRRTILRQPVRVVG